MKLLNTFQEQDWYVNQLYCSNVMFNLVNTEPCFKKGCPAKDLNPISQDMENVN